MFQKIKLVGEIKFNAIFSPISRLHNKKVYVQMSLRKMVNKHTCKDLQQYFLQFAGYIIRKYMYR